MMAKEPSKPRGRFFGAGGVRKPPPDDTMRCDKCMSDNVRSLGVSERMRGWSCNACSNEWIEPQ